MIPRRLRKKYHKLFKSHLEEIKKYYEAIMHDFGVNYKIHKKNFISLEEPGFKFDGHTIYRDKFLKNIEKLESKYFHHHNLIKNIFLHQQVPSLLFDFRRYRLRGTLDFFE